MLQDSAYLKKVTERFGKVNVPLKDETEWTKMLDRPHLIPARYIQEGDQDKLRIYCMKIVEKTQIHKLGHGSHGAVFSFHEEKSNRLSALKVAKDTPNALQRTKRDVHFLRLLNGTGLTATLKDAWRCGGYIYTLSELFTRDMEQQGRLQMHNYLGGNPKLTDNVKHFLKTTVLYTLDQFRQMLDIALILGFVYNIAQLDVKPNNYLYREADGRIVIADFEFATDFKHFDAKSVPPQGWTRSHLGCDLIKQSDELEAFVYDNRRYLNLWQMLMVCHNMLRAYVVLPSGHIAQVVGFGGAYDIPYEVQAKFISMCDAKKVTQSLLILTNPRELYEQGIQQIAVSPDRTDAVFTWDLANPQHYVDDDFSASDDEM